VSDERDRPPHEWEVGGDYAIRKGWEAIIADLQREDPTKSYTLVRADTGETMGIYPAPRGPRPPDDAPSEGDAR
jgi:hypothetical protein